MNINKITNDFAQAQNAYEKAFRQFLTQLPLLPNDRFWTIVKTFQKIVFNSRKPVDEFFRRPQVNSFYGETPYSFMETMQFISTWKNFKSLLYKPLFDIVEDRGDDGYNDLLDALPLAGEIIVNNCLNKKYDYEEFQEAVINVHEKAKKIILNGENYFVMMMSEEAQRRYVHEIAAVPS